MEELKFNMDENNKIIIEFSGRISTDNAAAVEKELTKAREENSEKQMIFDFEKLDYISSAGLRTILKTAQMHKDNRISIINISSMMYELFEDTGFTKLFDISKPLDQ